MNCSFRSRRMHDATSLEECLKRNGLTVLSYKDVCTYVNSLTSSTESKLLFAMKYCSVRCSREMRRMWRVLASLVISIWVAAALFCDTDTKSLIFWGGAILITFVVIVVMREYFHARGFIRVWRHTSLIPIDNWQKMRDGKNEILPQKTRQYLEKLADVNSELVVRLQHTEGDGINCTGTFLVLYDSRTSKTYFALFWH